jgi:hypothetical protein
LTSAIRLYFIIRLWYSDVEDEHYSVGYTLNTVEVNLAIVTATIPALWPLARRWFPAMFESMGINRPYLYPDIEVGYVPSSDGRRPSQQQRAAGGGEEGAGPGASGAAGPQRSSSPALQGRILWLQRPRPPSFLRGTPDGGCGGGPGSSVGLTDIRGQRGVYGATLKRWTVGSGGHDGGEEGEEDDDDDDGLFEDYHGMIRRTEMKLVHEEDDASTAHKPPQSEATGSSTDVRS